MTQHNNDSLSCGYPAGVTDATRVRVLIAHNGKTTEHTGQAQSFGWSIAPAYCTGLNPVVAPITHYEILD